MIIRVKSKHIKHSNYTTAECPIALAIQEQTKYDIVRVDFDDKIRLYMEKLYPHSKYVLSTVITTMVKEINMPTSVKRFLTDYYKYGRQKVKPFNFRLKGSINTRTYCNY